MPISTNVTRPTGKNSSFNNIYLLNELEVSQLTEYLTSKTFLDDIALLFSYPAENIISLKCYPLALTQFFDNITAEKDIIKIGNLNTGIGCHKIDTKEAMDLIPEAKFTVEPKYNNFLDYSPYTKIELYLPYIGFIDLDTELIIGKEVSIIYSIDLYTGDCNAVLQTNMTADDGNIYPVVIKNATGKIGVDIQIGGGQAQEIANNLLKLGINTAGNTALAVVNPVAGGIGISNTLVNAVNAGREKIQKGTPTGSMLNMYMPQSPYLIITRPDIIMPEYQTLKGIPFCKTSALSDLKGYTVVDSVHVEDIKNGIVSATETEIKEIESLLKSGVIL